MELELKHLAPYLPYGFKILEPHTGNIRKMNLGQGRSSSWVGLKTVLRNQETSKERYTVYSPILRPLSDLTKEIEHNGEKFIPFENFMLQNHNIQEIRITLDPTSDDFMIYDLHEDGEGNTSEISCSYEFYRLLFEWNFDVFGLIDKGLAIDINTI